MWICTCWYPPRPGDRIRSPRTGVIGSCTSSDVHAGNWTQMPCKSRKPFLQSPGFTWDRTYTDDLICNFPVSVLHDWLFTSEIKASTCKECSDKAIHHKRQKTKSTLTHEKYSTSGLETVAQWQSISLSSSETWFNPQHHNNKNKK